MIRTALAVGASLALSACGAPPPEDSTSQLAGDIDPINWKVAYMTGDDSINAFDNGRVSMAEIFATAGVADENTVHLSRGQSGDGVLPTSIANFEAAMNDLDVGPGDGCAVFMTSHGTRTGFYIRGQSYLTPAMLDQILDDACGDRPTIALISACYSGVFVEPLRADNRIILTAARHDRTSFGCSPEAEYTYWDGCMIANIPTSPTWEGLYASVKTCIEEKESRGGFTPSFPQGSFGAGIRNAPIFGT